MANINILSRMNVIEFLKSKTATKMDFVKSKELNKDGSTKIFFALNNSEKSVVDGKEIIGTRGAISKALQDEIRANKALSVNDVVVADTTMEGKEGHCWLLMKAGEANRLGGFAL